MVYIDYLVFVMKYREELFSIRYRLSLRFYLASVIISPVLTYPSQSIVSVLTEKLALFFAVRIGLIMRLFLQIFSSFLVK